jgi:hypothetical protein
MGHACLPFEAGQGFSSFLLQVGLQETFSHLLNAWVSVADQPSRASEIEFQIAMFDGPMIPFTDEMNKKDAGRNWGSTLLIGGGSRVSTSGNGESCRIPNARQGRPAAVAGISQIAESLQNVLRRNFAFVAGSRAMAAPSSPERKPRRVRPRAVFQSCYWHEVWAGQLVLLRRRNGRDWQL